jgi:hypothetical protein
MSSAPVAASQAPSPSGGKPQRPLGRRLRRAFWLFVFAAVLLTAAYVALMARFSYSNGERAGYVQKFSRKGWLCKTWEGELAMANLPGTMPEVFAFTVWDDGVAGRINGLMGQRVVLHYEEKVGLPTSCFGETRHFVDGVRPVAQP